MRCIRVHRARRAWPCVAALLAVVGAVQRTEAQQYPVPTYPAPTYPQPQYPGYPGYPQYPQYPQPAQPGVPASAPTSVVLPAYRAPVIAIAQPNDGIAIPDDKPVAVFRFASNELLDPLDALSFSVTVDGNNRTSLFQLTQGEAWGPLASVGELLATGQHDVRARICTSRGACSVAKATVNVVPASSMIQLSAGAASTQSKAARAGRVLETVLQAARVLIH
jgi:hypothetical protein